MPRIKKTIRLTEEEKEQLIKVVNGQKSEQRLVLRSSIILMLAGGQSEKEVAKELGVDIKTVRKWRDRYTVGGFDALKDLPRSGAPGKFSIVQRCEVIAIACDKPKNYGYDTHNQWNLDILTDAVNKSIKNIEMSRSSVARTLNMNELKPHKFRMWLHSKDPKFKEKVNNIVSLYVNPPKDAVVLCIDEKTGMQATERIVETVMPKPGHTGRYEYEYVRHGTQALIAAFDIKTGKVLAQCNDTRTAEDLLAFMEEVARAYCEEKKIHVIWDNLNIHKDGACSRWTEFNRKYAGKFEFHYTPKHASWVNQIEVFFSILNRRCLRLSSFRSKEELREAVMMFIRIWNEKEGHPFKWKFKGYPMQSKSQ